MAINSSIILTLPTLLECSEIPDNTAEIPLPQVAQKYSHLKSIASEVSLLDPNTQILLLLGHDILRAKL